MSNLLQDNFIQGYKDIIVMSGPQKYVWSEITSFENFFFIAVILFFHWYIAGCAEALVSPEDNRPIEGAGLVHFCLNKISTAAFLVGMFSILNVIFKLLYLAITTL